MIEPLASVAAVAPARAPSRPASVEPVAPTAAAPAVKAAPEPQIQAAAEHKQLAMDVKKADDGVFVYTLSDPETHAVIVVIPRKSVDGSQEGQAVDTRV